MNALVIDVSRLSYEVIARVLGEARAEALAIARVGERVLLDCEMTQATVTATATAAATATAIPAANESELLVFS